MANRDGTLSEKPFPQLDAGGTSANLPMPSVKDGN